MAPWESRPKPKHNGKGYGNDAKDLAKNTQRANQRMVPAKPRNGLPQVAFGSFYLLNF